MAKKVLITGGNRGIGQAITLAFAKRGDDVLFTFHSDPYSADEVLTEIQALGGNAKAIQVNLQKESDWDRLINESDTFLGDIDVFVSNAGIATRNNFLDLTQEEVKKVLDVNVFAPFFVIQKIARKMVEFQKKRHEKNEPLKDYAIVFISSISRNVIMPNLSHYEMSKAAISQFSRSLSQELSPYHIRVNDVAPGIIPTEINRKLWETNTPLWQERVSQIPLKRPGRPEDIAQAVLFCANSDWMTGSTLTVDGGRSHNWLGSAIS